MNCTFRSPSVELWGMILHILEFLVLVYPSNDNYTFVAVSLCVTVKL